MVAKTYHLLSLVYLGKVTFKGHVHVSTQQGTLAFLSSYHVPQKSTLLVNPRSTLSSRRGEERRKV